MVRRRSTVSDVELVAIDQNTVFAQNRMSEAHRGCHYRVSVYLLLQVETIHLLIVILDLTTTIEMMIIDIETTGMKVVEMITIGAEAIVIIMVVMITDMDPTAILSIPGSVDAAMSRHIITMIETVRHMEVGVAAQVIDGSRMSGIGHRVDTIKKTSRTMMVVEENVVEATIGVVAEGKRRSGTVVAALDHLVVLYSLAQCPIRTLLMYFQ